MDSDNKALVSVAGFIGIVLACVAIFGSSCTARVTRVNQQGQTQRVTACVQAGEQWVNRNCVVGK